MGQENNKDFDRRQFFARVGKAGVSIAAAGTIAGLLYDKKRPTENLGAKKLVTLPDFSVAKQEGKIISVVKGEDRVKSVGKAIELLGGIERFIKPGDIVAIKPNVAFASPAMLCATTNPQLIGEVVRLCKNAGSKEVIVIDNPINDPASCFTLSGISKAATQAGAKIILPRSDYFKNTTLAGGQLIKDWPIFYEPLRKVNKLIGIAPVKNHRRSGASMAMKNWYGLLGGRRNIFHQDINNIIVELAMMVRPTLVILDGVESMMSNGPTGGSVSDLRKTNTMIASSDMVAADSYGCQLLDMKVSDLAYLTMAEKAGIGTTDYETLKPILAT